jgi:hypothetical protein
MSWSMTARTRIAGTARGRIPIRFLILKRPSVLMALQEPTICSTLSALPNGSSRRSYWTSLPSRFRIAFPC